jgi:hypothetical protein
MNIIPPKLELFPGHVVGIAEETREDVAPCRPPGFSGDGDLPSLSSV